MKTSLYSFLTAVLLVCLPQTVLAQFSVDVETGLVSTGYNDLRAPNPEGTLISLNKDLSANPAYFYRLRTNYAINERHHLSLLFAPLKIKSDGSFPLVLHYNGATFAPNTPLDVTYVFNSYRFTYRYDIVRKEKLEFGLGLTAKIRDAKIGMVSSTQTTTFSNLGFVPIINFRLFWRAFDNIGVLFEGDALAAKQGRAEDVQLALTYDIAQHIRLRAGYRLLEGGADNSRIYTFSLFHYASLGLTYSF